MVAVSDLSFAYPNGRKLSFGSFKIDHGHHTLLLGESGSGKTTLLHLIGGLLTTYTGSIDVAGTDISKLSTPELDRFRGKHVGFVFQKMHLIRALSVSQNLRLAPFLAGVDVPVDQVEKVFSTLNLADKAAESVSRLSHGQAQRVAIAR